MNNDQLGILRLVADAADEYVQAMEESSNPNTPLGKKPGGAQTESAAMNAAQAYEKLQTAVERYRTAFNIE